MTETQNTMEWIELALIDWDVENHRLVTDSKADGELLESILANGVLQPVMVSTKPDGRYTLVFGFRRKAAAKHKIKSATTKQTTGEQRGQNNQERTRQINAELREALGVGTTGHTLLIRTVAGAQL